MKRSLIMAVLAVVCAGSYLDSISVRDAKENSEASVILGWVYPVSGVKRG